MNAICSWFKYKTTMHDFHDFLFEKHKKLGWTGEPVFACFLLKVLFFVFRQRGIKSYSDMAERSCGDGAYILRRQLIRPRWLCFRFEVKIFYGLICGIVSIGRKKLRIKFRKRNYRKQLHVECRKFQRKKNREMKSKEKQRV